MADIINQQTPSTDRSNGFGLGLTLGVLLILALLLWWLFWRNGAIMNDTQTTNPTPTTNQMQTQPSTDNNEEGLNGNLDVDIFNDNNDSQPQTPTSQPTGTTTPTRTTSPTGM